MKKIMILLLCLGVLTACGSKVNEEEVKENLYIEFDEEALTLNIGDCFDYAAAVKKTNGDIKPISDICAIAEEPGERTYTYTVCDKEHSDICKEVTATFTVLERSLPVITFNSVVEMTAGDTPNVLKGVVAVDQDNNILNVEVIGDWDSQIPGTYQLKYRATDEDGLTKEEPFTLIIHPKEDSTAEENPVALCPGGDYPEEPCDFIPNKTQLESTYEKIFWEFSNVDCEAELESINPEKYTASCEFILNNERKVVGWGLSKKEK